jgi:hypothetical protein
MKEVSKDRKKEIEGSEAERQNQDNQKSRQPKQDDKRDPNQSNL